MTIWELRQWGESQVTLEQYAIMIAAMLILWTIYGWWMIVRNK